MRTAIDGVAHANLHEAITLNPFDEAVRCDPYRHYQTPQRGPTREA